MSESLYWLAPDLYCGNKLQSYGSNLVFTISWVSGFLLSFFLDWFFVQNSLKIEIFNFRMWCAVTPVGSQRIVQQWFWSEQMAWKSLMEIIFFRTQIRPFRYSLPSMAGINCHKHWTVTVCCSRAITMAILCRDLSFYRCWVMSTVLCCAAVFIPIKPKVYWFVRRLNTSSRVKMNCAQFRWSNARAHKATLVYHVNHVILAISEPMKILRQRSNWAFVCRAHAMAMPKHVN